MLVDQDLVAVRIEDDEAGGALRGLVGRDGDRHTGRLQLPLQVADIGEGRLLLSVAVPTGVERQDVLLEQALKEADDGVAVLQDEVSLAISGKGLESERLVELPGGRQILERLIEKAPRSMFFAPCEFSV